MFEKKQKRVNKFDNNKLLVKHLHALRETYSKSWGDRGLQKLVVRRTLSSLDLKQMFTPLNDEMHCVFPEPLLIIENLLILVKKKSSIFSSDKRLKKHR